MSIINEFCKADKDVRGIARLTVRNAGALNILHTGAIEAVRLVLAELARDDGVRVLIFRCESEKAFVGGADIKEMATLDQTSAERFITGLGGLCEAVRQFPVPVIARIPGWCLGGGLEVAAACDIRIAAPAAKFAMPEVKVGIPSVIHAALLPRLVGAGRARWLVMTGATIDASTALGWGLVDVLSEPDKLDAAVEATVAELLACGHEALKAQKLLCRQWDELPLQECVRNSVTTFGEAFLTGEPQRQMQAFLDRKKPT
ncbi:MAG: enoyl-CoA hydratase [Xanthobacteraceae bacterium]|nr:enoyl-CoA hydratase [Xanthobacteraceae bacterium]